MTVTVRADLMLRTSNNLVLTTLDACDGQPYTGLTVNVLDIRNGHTHSARVAQIDERARHVMLSMDDDAPTRLEVFRGQNAFTELLNEAQSRARRAYNTGNRAQSATCIGEHLTSEEREDLIKADVFSCPECGHQLKDRNL